MRKCFAIAVSFFAMIYLASPASAHRLDEYLQATIITITDNHVLLDLHMTPSVAVSKTVIADIDRDSNGVLSEAEQRAYAQRVCRDLSLLIDGSPAPLRLLLVDFPTVSDVLQGQGEILLRMEADAPTVVGGHRLVFENHYDNQIGAYLVNCLVPRDPNIHVIRQDRNLNQSRYQLDYTEAAADPITRKKSTASAGQTLDGPGESRALFETYFVHGVYHILTGYDHLLFISALVLAATTLWDLVKVVSVFTLAHSITLTLASLQLVRLPAQVVEPMISASIVFVALQNVIRPGSVGHRSRLAAAFFFGLFHGLGFAGGLLDVMREMPRGTILLSILAFSVGVEAGHQLVVLPLFGILKLARHAQPDAVRRTQVSIAIQRIASAGISAAGVYYLSVALFTPS